MKLIVYSASRSFERFLNDQLDFAFEFCPRLQPPSADPDQLYMLHMTGMELDCYEWLLNMFPGSRPRLEPAPIYPTSVRCSSVCGWAPRHIAIATWLHCIISRCLSYWRTTKAGFHHKCWMRPSDWLSRQSNQSPMRRNWKC